MKRAGHPVVWACDPMHGNTYTHESGYKTRHFDAVMHEVEQFFAACRAGRCLAGRGPRRAHRRRRHRMPRRRRRRGGASSSNDSTRRAATRVSTPASRSISRSASASSCNARAERVLYDVFAASEALYVVSSRKNGVAWGDKGRGMSDMAPTGELGPNAGPDRRDVSPVPGEPERGLRRVARVLRRLPAARRGSGRARASRPGGHVRRPLRRPHPLLPRRRRPSPRRPRPSTVKLRNRCAASSARIVENMEASLGVPTATSVRTLPAQAARDQPSDPEQPARARPGREGQLHAPHRLRGRARIAVAPANECELRRRRRYAERRAPRAREPRPRYRPAESRRHRARCSSRTSKRPTRSTSPRSTPSYEDLIRRARANKLTLDDFANTTVSLTNPGTIGTLHSVPRLMPGQGVIVGVGAITYPPEYEGADPQTLAEIGVSKIVTLTSTYDHRIIQGAESGEFLARMHDLLLGGDDFYDDIFASLRRPLRAGALVDRQPQPARRRRRRAEQSHRGAAAHQHVPRARPPDREPRPARFARTEDARRARSEPLGPHDLGSRPRVPDRRPRRSRR